MGDYISRVFPFLGVRFISINDGFRAAAIQLNIDGLDASFRTLITTCTARDLSRRVKSAKGPRAEGAGRFSEIPYAPLTDMSKGPEDKKNHLLGGYGSR